MLVKMFISTTIHYIVMEVDTKASVYAGLVVFFIIGLFLLPFIVWGFFIKEFNTNGQVSSVKFENHFFWKSKCVEYYGGQENCVWASYDLSEIKPNTVCAMDTHGFYLDRLECQK